MKQQMKLHNVLSPLFLFFSIVLFIFYLPVFLEYGEVILTKQWYRIPKTRWWFDIVMLPFIIMNVILQIKALLQIAQNKFVDQKISFVVGGFGAALVLYIFLDFVIRAGLR